LVAAGVVAEGVANDEAYKVVFSPDTPATELVEFAVRALQALGAMGMTGEWQWTVRPKGAYPR
jgi:hypothetical protein